MINFMRTRFLNLIFRNDPYTAKKTFFVPASDNELIMQPYNLGFNCAFKIVDEGNDPIPSSVGHFEVLHNFF